MITTPILDVESLLRPRYPDATLHDALLLRVDVDYRKRETTLHFRIPTSAAPGVPEYHDGRLILSGMEFCACDSPRSPPSEWDTGHRWITSDGPFPDEHLVTTLTLPDGLPTQAFRHYFFASDTNSVIVVAARAARFDWID